MNKWILGTLGFVLGGPIGAVIGVVLGSFFEGISNAAQVDIEDEPETGTRSSQRATQGDIRMSLLVLIACVIKADGRVLKSEVNFIKPYLVKTYGEEGAKVFCAYDGVVKSVENSLLTGVTVTVDHGDGLITLYNSLLDTEDVWVGMRLNKGDVIGVMSTSNRQEYKDGAHLHFEAFENGVSVNPEKYLSIDNK